MSAEMKRKIPKRIKCKICEQMFDNPLLKGSGIVLVTCDACRRAMYSPATLKRMEQEGTQKTDEQILEDKFSTLKQPKNTLSTY